MIIGQMQTRSTAQITQFQAFTLINYRWRHLPFDGATV
jgi:hypothetical protein